MFQNIIKEGLLELVFAVFFADVVRIREMIFRLIFSFN